MEKRFRHAVESSSGADDARRIFIMPQQIQSLRQSGCFTLGLNSFRGSIKDHFSLSLPLSFSPPLCLRRGTNKHDSSPAISCPLPRWIAKLVFVNASTQTHSNLCLTNWTAEAIRAHYAQGSRGSWLRILRVIIRRFVRARFPKLSRTRLMEIYQINSTRVRSLNQNPFVKDLFSISASLSHDSLARR